jgi:hypothetical protein
MRKMDVRSRIVVCLLVAAITLICGAVCAEPGPPISKSKKIIGWACNTVEPSYLRQYVRDIEQLPIDGIVISVYADNWTGRRTGQEERWFGGRRLPREDFKQVVADMKATRFRRLKDNFINFGFTARGAANEAEANLDWFDPNWSTIAENGATAAWITREAGFKGLYMDIEAYGEGLGNWRYPFDYYKYVEFSGDKSRTYAQYAQQAQKRGREWMKAVTAVYPTITIVMIEGTGWGRSDLLDPFVRGMLEERGKATIIDGGESGYSMITRSEFVGLKEAGAGYHKDPLYKPIQQAFGVWVDPTPDQYGGWHTDPADFDKNYRTPSDFENTLYGALTTSDKYVWLFVWHPDVWWNPKVRPRPLEHQCKLCPHKEVPAAYIQALRDCRKPHDLDWAPAFAADRFVCFDDAVLAEGTTISEGSVNLLKNGGFEAWSSGPNASPDAWVASGQSPVVAQEGARVKSGASSARITSTLIQAHVFFDQRIPVGNLAGKTVTLGAWVWSAVAESGDLQILDYFGATHDVGSSDGHPGDGQWHWLTATKTIRPEATGEICLRLSGRMPFIRAKK